MKLRVLVAYETRYGNSQRVAEALSRGLSTSVEIEVECHDIAEVDPGGLDSYDVLVLGGPTESHSASGPMKEFLAHLYESDLAGKRAVVFETRRDGPLTGSAAAYLAHHLAEQGMTVLRPTLTARVRPLTRPEYRHFGSESDPDWLHPTDPQAPAHILADQRGPDLLAPGTVAEFERTGAELARRLLTNPLPTPA
jgi:flavodoxin